MHCLPPRPRGIYRLQKSQSRMYPCFCNFKGLHGGYQIFFNILEILNSVERKNKKLEQLHNVNGDVLRVFNLALKEIFIYDIFLQTHLGVLGRARFSSMDFQVQLLLSIPLPSPPPSTPPPRNVKIY